AGFDDHVELRPVLGQIAPRVVALLRWCRIGHARDDRMWDRRIRPGLWTTSGGDGRWGRSVLGRRFRTTAPGRLPAWRRAARAHLVTGCGADPARFDHRPDDLVQRAALPAGE